LTGAFWYVRNLVETGSIEPTVRVGIGPIALPTVDVRRPFPAHRVVDFLTDFDVIRSDFLPGFRTTFGWGWPLLFLLAGAGCGFALLREQRLLRALGAVGLLCCVAYLFTPQGAAGTDVNRAFLFSRNLRYLYPALVIGLVLLPIVATRFGPRARAGLVAIGGAALGADLYYGLTGDRDETAIALGAMVAIFAVVAVAIVTWPAICARSLAPVAIGLALGLGVAAGWTVQHHYLERRYADALPFPSAPRAESELVVRVGNTIEGAHVGVAGLSFQYALFGPDFSNRVTFIGKRGPHGAFAVPTSCRQWRELVNEGAYDYVVVGADDAADPEPREAGWTRVDRSVDVVEHDGTASLFRIRGRLDPAAC
jgi:hypothetical protein